MIDKIWNWISLYKNIFFIGSVNNVVLICWINEQWKVFFWFSFRSIFVVIHFHTFIHVKVVDWFKNFQRFLGQSTLQIIRSLNGLYYVQWIFFLIQSQMDNSKNFSFSCFVPNSYIILAKVIKYTILHQNMLCSGPNVIQAIYLDEIEMLLVYKYGIKFCFTLSLCNLHLYQHL